MYTYSTEQIQIQDYQTNPEAKGNVKPYQLARAVLSFSFNERVAGWKRFWIENNLYNILKFNGSKIDNTFIPLLQSMYEQYLHFTLFLFKARVRLLAGLSLIEGLLQESFENIPDRVWQI